MKEPNMLLTILAFWIIFDAGVARYSNDLCYLSASHGAREGGATGEEPLLAGGGRPQEIGNVMEVKRSADLASVAAGQGIVADDMSSIPSQVARCCSSSTSCWRDGGICLPSWLKIFFSCYKDGQCYRGSCTCVKPKEKCTDCTGVCASGGTCRKTCNWPEVSSSSYKCGTGCNCCYRCSGSCSGGTCRNSCSSNEIDDGKCAGHKNCRCCKEKVCSGSCNGGTCKKACSSTETDSGQCPNKGHCRCCKQRVIESVECIGRCARFGHCRKFCLAFEVDTGSCSGSCRCCQQIEICRPGEICQ